MSVDPEPGEQQEPVEQSSTTAAEPAATFTPPGYDPSWPRFGVGRRLMAVSGTDMSLLPRIGPDRRRRQLLGAYALLVPVLMLGASLVAETTVLHAKLAAAIPVSLFLFAFVLIVEMSIVSDVPAEEGGRRQVLWVVWRILFSLVVFAVITDLASLSIYGNTLQRLANDSIVQEQAAASAAAAQTTFHGGDSQRSELTTQENALLTQQTTQTTALDAAKTERDFWADCLDAEGHGKQHPGCGNSGNSGQKARYTQIDDKLTTAQSQLNTASTNLADTSAKLTTVEQSLATLATPTAPPTVQPAASTTSPAGVLDLSKALWHLVGSDPGGVGLWFFAIAFFLLLIDMGGLAYAMLGGGGPYETNVRAMREAVAKSSEAYVSALAEVTYGSEQVRAAWWSAAYQTAQEEINRNPPTIDLSALIGNSEQQRFPRLVPPRAQSASGPKPQGDRPGEGDDEASVRPEDENDRARRRLDDLHAELVARGMPDRYRLIEIFDKHRSISCEHVIFARDHKGTGHDVVLKVVRLAGIPATDRRLRNQWKREIDILQGLSGAPHIGELIAAHELRDGHVLALRRYRPGDLLAWVVQEQSYSLKNVLAWLSQILEALDNATFRRGVIRTPTPVIHCDISPPNVALEAVDGRLRVRLLDFGIARFVRELNAASPSAMSEEFPRGRAYFASPEQLLRPTADWMTPFTDIYSTFALVYFLLCGLGPWQAEYEIVGDGDARDVAQFIEEEWAQGRRPLPLDVLLPGLSSELANLIEDMLDPSPDTRQRSAGSVPQLRARIDQLQHDLRTSGADMILVGPGQSLDPRSVASVHQQGRSRGGRSPVGGHPAWTPAQPTPWAHADHEADRLADEPQEEDLQPVAVVDGELGQEFQYPAQLPGTEDGHRARRTGSGGDEDATPDHRDGPAEIDLTDNKADRLRAE